MMGYTSHNAGAEGQMRRGSRVPLESEVQVSRDTSATLRGHWSSFRVPMPTEEGPK